MKMWSNRLFTKEEMTIPEWIGGAFFWLGFLFEITYLIFKRIGYDLPIETYWLRGVAFCFCIKIVCTRYTRGEWAFLIFLGLTGMVGYYLSGMDVFFRTAVFVTSSKGINRRTAVQALWITLMVSAALYIVRGFMGIGNPIALTKEYRGGIIETRYCFGYSHPNGLHYSMFAIMLLFVWLYHEKLEWKHYAAFLLLNTFLFYFTRSRTGAVVSYLVIFFCWVLTYADKLRRNKGVYALGYVAMAVVCLVSMTVLKVYAGTGEYPAWDKLNQLLTGRLGFAHEALYNRELTFFPELEKSFPSIDIGLLDQLFRFGILYSFFYIVSQVGLLYKAGRERNHIEYVTVVSIVIYMGIEAIQTSSLYPTQNFIWILLIDQWYRLFGKKSVKE